MRQRGKARKHGPVGAAQLERLAGIGEARAAELGHADQWRRRRRRRIDVIVLNEGLVHEQSEGARREDKARESRLPEEVDQHVAAEIDLDEPVVNDLDPFLGGLGSYGVREDFINDDMRLWQGCNTRKSCG